VTDTEHADKLEAILKKDSTNFQWPKLILNVSMMIILLFISLFRGNGEYSLIGVQRCSFADYGLLVVLFLIAIVLTIIGVKIFSKEYQAKVDIDY